MLTDTWKMSWFGNYNPNWDLKSDYGFVHMYALFMTLGVILAISLSGYKLWRKQILLSGLYIGAVPIVIISLFGASFFGKMPIGVPFWQCFAFWHGGMSIHGGVLFGALSGILVFYLVGRKTYVSVLTYMDAIIPNILIGQAIGRWGNFFNHELVGQPVSIVGQKNIFSWFPDFILRNTQFVYNGDKTIYKGIDLIPGIAYQMTPIFIIESFFLFISWLLITFLIPGICRLISKKPWKVDSSLSVDFKLTFKKPYSKIKTEKGYTYWEVWNKAYYFNDNEESIKQYIENINQLNEQARNKKISYIKYRYKCGKELKLANNPHNYKIAYAGIEAGVYFFLWNMVRFSLESIRPEDVLFISYKRNLSLILVAAAASIGIVIILLSIFVLPYFCRNEDFIFEKKYFYLGKLSPERISYKQYKKISR